MKRLFTFLFCILVCFSVRAQLSTNEKPISFIRSSEMDSNRQIDKRIMSALDMEASRGDRCSGHFTHASVPPATETAIFTKQ